MSGGDISALESDDVVMVDVDAPPESDRVGTVGGTGDGVDSRDSVPFSEFSSPEVLPFLIDWRMFNGIF